MDGELKKLRGQVAQLQHDNQDLVQEVGKLTGERDKGKREIADLRSKIDGFKADIKRLEDGAADSVTKKLDALPVKSQMWVCTGNVPVNGK